MLLFVNILEVVFAFGILYRYFLGLSTVSAIFKAVLVFGTIGYPEEAKGALALLVALQILLNFVLVALVISGFVGRIGLFSRSGHAESGQASATRPVQSQENVATNAVER